MASHLSVVDDCLFFSVHIFSDCLHAMRIVFNVESYFWAMISLFICVPLVIKNRLRLQRVAKQLMETRHELSKEVSAITKDLAWGSCTMVLVASVLPQLHAAGERARSFIVRITCPVHQA